MSKHGPSCRWPDGPPCRQFSTDGTRLGAAIAHEMGTTDEQEIVERGMRSNWEERQAALTGMEEEQADWDGD